MYSKLRGRIVERYGSQRKFSKDAGISNVSVTRKMTGKVGFSQKDIVKWSELLGIETGQIADFFYPESLNL